MKAACCARPTRKAWGRIALRSELPSRRRPCRTNPEKAKTSRGGSRRKPVKQCPSCAHNLADFVEFCPYCAAANSFGPRPLDSAGPVYGSARSWPARKQRQGAGQPDLWTGFLLLATCADRRRRAGTSGPCRNQEKCRASGRARHGNRRIGDRLSREERVSDPDRPGDCHSQSLAIEDGSQRSIGGRYAAHLQPGARPLRRTVSPTGLSGYAGLSRSGPFRRGSVCPRELGRPASRTGDAGEERLSLLLHTRKLRPGRPCREVWAWRRSGDAERYGHAALFYRSIRSDSGERTGRGGRRQPTIAMKPGSVGGGRFGHGQGFRQMGAVFFGGDGRTGGVAQNLADQLGVQRVARFVRLHASEQRQTDQRQVSNQVECFVTPEFVGITKRSVQDTVVGKNDRVVERSSPDQSHGAKRLNVAFKTKRAGAGQQG